MMILFTHLVLQEVRAEKKEGWKPIPAAAEVGGSKTQPDLCRNAHRTSSTQEGAEVRGLENTPSRPCSTDVLHKILQGETHVSPSTSIRGRGIA